MWKAPLPGRARLGGSLALPQASPGATSPGWQVRLGLTVHSRSRLHSGHPRRPKDEISTYSVVDGGGGFQNGMVLPAGPLREPVAQGLARADAVIVMGSGGRSPEDGRAPKRTPGHPELENFAGPILYARLVPLPNSLAGRRVFAFAGIGRPQKFFDTLKAVGARVTGTQDFADHHNYDAQDLQGLRDRAKGDLLVTTEKDLVRIAPEQRDGIVALAVEARFDDPAALAALLGKVTP